MIQIHAILVCMTIDPLHHAAEILELCRERMLRSEAVIAAGKKHAPICYLGTKI